MVTQAVILVGGEGTRLRPLTHVRPKPMCPVGDRPLVEHALDRLRPLASGAAAVAVNVHHGRELLEAHLAGRVHISVEADRALGTAGALGHLRDWVAGRAVVVVNGDTWTDAALPALLDGWDGERTRLLLSEPAPGSGPPGTVLDDRLTIACGTGAVRLLTLQRAGREPVDAAAFLRGWIIPPGHRLA